MIMSFLYRQRNIETRLHTKNTLSVLDTLYQNGSLDF